jgi:hypothetical protein
MALLRGEKRKRKGRTSTAIHDVGIDNKVIDRMSATERGRARSEGDGKRRDETGKEKKRGGIAVG